MGESHRASPHVSMDDANSARADTPESGVGDESHAQSLPKHPAVKDKHCQYCHQPFTSSSLGRHLDQYLFKKKPDRIHDVEEIRRLRSAITRRTTRIAGKPGSPGAAGTKSPGDSHSAPPLRQNAKPEGGYRILLNQPSWHA